MTNEEMFERLLNEVKTVIRDEVKTVVRDEVKEIKDEIKGIKDEVKGIKDDINELKCDVSGVKEQLDETNQIVKAIRHNQEYISAKVDKLELTTATTDSVIHIDNKIAALNSRLFIQEAAIQGLKRAK